MTENKRMHFGVLVASLDDTCQCSVLDGINEYAKGRDIDVSVYIGTHQAIGQYYVANYDTCYEIIRSDDTLDGLILFTGYITDIKGHDSFKEHFAEIYKHLPTVSISFDLPGMPTVLADNTSGIYSIVNHLIKTHGKKKIAFVKGPDGHPEAEERLSGYKKALEANGIKLDEDYILPGDFTPQCGYAAVAELTDVRKLPFDAIVASDDATATGVISELKNRGISVPKEVAVTGFDDDRAATISIPSISTVRQNFFKVGMVSMETLYREVSGVGAEAQTYIDPIVIHRQSCGCIGKELSEIKAVNSGIPGEKDCLDSYVLREFISLFRDNVPNEKIRDWVYDLIERIEAEPFDEKSFFRLTNEILIEYNHYSADFQKWHNAVDVLSRGIGFFSSELEYPKTILSTLISTTTFINDLTLNERKAMEFELTDAQEEIRIIMSTLVLTYDIDSLVKEMSESFPTLSINAAIIGMYRKAIKTGESGKDREIDELKGFSGEKIFSIKRNGSDPLILSGQHIIECFGLEQKRRTLFVFPLFFEDEEMGFLLLPYNAQMVLGVYENIRISVAAVVKGAGLLSGK